jgi:hypothetical protein
MAFLDQYIVNHTDHTLRLVGALDAGRSALPVVRVGSRDFQRYVDQGYRIYNPNNSGVAHRNAALGLHRVMQLTMPGYAMANEFIGGHGSQSRNLAAKRSRSNPELQYTNWAGVQEMKKRAKDAGEPTLVKVFAESTANHAFQQMFAAQQRGVLQQRIHMGVFNVTDKKRVYGYAPEKWIEEDYEKVRAAEDKEHDRQVDKMIADTKAIQERLQIQLRLQSAEIQARMDPKMAALEAAVEKRVNEIENKGVDAKENSLAAKAVEKKAEAAEKELTRLQKIAKVAAAGVRGAKSGWAGKETGFEADREPLRYGKPTYSIGGARRGRRR